MDDGIGTNPGMFGDRGSACIQNNAKDLSIGGHRSSDNSGQIFKRFSTPMWQSACVDTVRGAMVCDVYFPFSKNLNLRDCALIYSIFKKPKANVFIRH